MKKQWLITLVGLTLALAAITGGGIALAGNGTGTPEVGEPSGGQGPIRSDEDIDPNVCNPIHNIKACTPEELEELGMAPSGTASTVEAPLHGDPTYEQWLSEFGDGQVVTSIDDIDPNVCNPIHNITACTPEELEELGIEWYTPTVEAPLHGDPTYEQWLSEFGDGQVFTLTEGCLMIPLITVISTGTSRLEWSTSSYITACEGTEPGIAVDEEGTIEPDFGEDGPFLVPDRDAVCGPDQAVSITSDGQASCWDIGDASQTDDGQDMVSPGAPPVVELAR